MPQVRFDINQRGPRPAQRPKPLRPRAPAAIRQQLLRDEAKKERRMPEGMVRVKATNRLGEGIIGKFIYHPSGHRTFNKDGIAEWPMDSFTRNRVRDGDVTIEAAGAERAQVEQRPEQRQENDKRRPQREAPRTEHPAQSS
jgi:hypothetical protein